MNGTGLEIETRVQWGIPFQNLTIFSVMPAKTLILFRPKNKE